MKINKKEYELKALIYAEKYGKIEYKVEKNQMVWFESYRGEHNSFKCFLDLDTMKETKTKLSRYYKKYEYNC